MPTPTRAGTGGRRFAALAVPGILAACLLAAVPAPAAGAEEPVDGARTSTDPMFPNVGNGGYDALDYDIAIAWTPDAVQSGATIAGSIVATSTMTATAPEPLRSFSLDFEGLEVDSVTVDGVPAAWERDVDAAAIKYKLIVTPATPVSGEFEVTVAYHGVPTSHTDLDGSSEGWNATSDGATLLGQPIGMMTGYPHNNTPADKATYTMTLDIPSVVSNVAGVPGTAAAVGNGELVSKTPSADGSRTTWVWNQSEQMASELVIVSIGRYDVIESSVTLGDGRVIPSWSFMDSALSEANKQTIRNRETQLGTIIRNLETLYGPYPGNSTGVVVDSVPSGINYALETQDRSFFPSTGSVAGNTLIHELVHQWYGDNVSPTTWTDIWIGEGMATWGPTYYNSLEGFGTSANSSETVYFNSWNNSAATSPNWQIPPGGQVDSAELYGYQTYTRSAQFWAALRIAIGDDAFFALIEQWQTRHGGTSRTGADLQALAEELSGRDLDAFWTDWILEPGKPAWPEKLTVALAAATDAAVLNAGDVVTYTLTAANTGRVPLASSVVTVDLAEVLARTTLGSLPAGVTLEGTTLTWAVPATAVGARPATASFTATVAKGAPAGPMTATAAVATLGGTCTDCAVSVGVDTAKPVATLVSPAASGPFQSLAVQVDATDDQGLRRVVANVYRDGKLVKSTQTAADGATSATHTATVALGDGAYTVKFNAEDLAGNIASTGTFAFTIDATAPVVTVKEGSSFTVATGSTYDKVSFKLHDPGKIDRVVLNGTVKDLTDNAWSDLNFVRPGVFGAVPGANTLVVYDVAGNAATVPFVLN
ncbi:M1 family aminopeptidase [Agromyces sp. LHK192]|uniref:M1 family aminopeptidase n=1 Tax=Agromyces sp. LHK192 TaxID=2498704 RepID=UPI000FD8DF3B|nr:M1 family aminopeptidase [Agromyces sp. LHK192]